MKVYLGGPIDGCSDEEASGWRREASEYLISKGHEPLDPMRRDYRLRALTPAMAQEIVDYDLQDIDEADILFMNCSKPSVGTSMEIVYGHQKRKQVIAVIPGGRGPSPWLVAHANQVLAGPVLEVLKKVIA